MSDRLHELTRMGGGHHDEEEDEYSSKKKRGRAKDKVIVNVQASDEDEKYSSADETKLFEPIKEGIQTVRDQTSALRKLDLNAVDERSSKQLTKSIERIMSRSTGAGQSVKRALDEIKASIAAGKKSGAKGMAARTNLFNSSAKDFHGVMQEYNSEYSAVKHRITENKKRQLRNLPTDTPLSEEQIESVLDAGKEGEVMQKAMMMEDLSNLQDIVADVEERHAEILKLERQVIELLELFKDLSMLVDQQGEKIDVIDQHIVRTKDNTEKGEKALVSAEKSQIAARKKRCILLLILVAVLVVILVLGGYFGGIFGSS